VSRRLVGPGGGISWAGLVCVIPGAGSCVSSGLWTAKGAAVEDVGVDLGGADVLVAEELLDGADVVAGLEEMGREAVA
jgi:hypothetical protein